MFITDRSKPAHVLLSIEDYRQNVMVGSWVRIGRGVKVQNNVSIYAGVTFGEASGHQERLGLVHDSPVRPRCRGGGTRTTGYSDRGVLPQAASLAARV